MKSAGRAERLQRELAEKKLELKVLRRVATELNSTLRLEEIYDIVLKTMDDLFGFRHSLILLLEEGGGALTVAAARGYRKADLGARVPLGSGVIGTAARQRKILRIGNLGRMRSYAAAVRRQAEAEGEVEGLGEAPRLPGLKDAETQIAIPLLIRDTLVGVFSVESAEKHQFSERDETLASIVSSLTASAIHNALLYRRLEQRKAELARANEALADRVEQRTRELERTTRELSVAKALQASGGRGLSIDDIVGESRPMRAAKRLLRKVASSPGSTVLITGENGTGKDLAAKAIHFASDRAARSFMNITCSALPEALLESELFGHERGAFTDARAQKKGLLELADGGTVFLDEIGEMSLGLQAKLLRFLEEKAFRRVGGTQDIRVNVRVIAATNRELKQEVREGRFREDLYYRLRVLPVELPPLRERAEDLPLLAALFLEQYCREFGRTVRGPSPAALSALASYGWPGNVRELKNAIERAVLLADGPLLEEADFRWLLAGAELGGGFRLPAEGLCFDLMERDLVTQALERTGWNKAAAARLLGVDRDWIRYRIERHALSPASSPGASADRAVRGLAERG